MSYPEMLPTSSSNKPLNPLAPSYFPCKFLIHSTHPPLPSPPPPLIPLLPRGFSPIFHLPNTFIHANFNFNFNFIPHETIQRFTAKQFPSSPSHAARHRRFRRGKKFGGFRNDEGRKMLSFPSGGESSDGSGQMALTVTTKGRFPRIVNSYRKDVEYGCRGGKGDKRREKTVVPVSEGRCETTVMIRNIPNKYTKELLIQFLDDHCLQENQMKGEADEDKAFVSAYDFIYLPLDLRSDGFVDTIVCSYLMLSGSLIAVRDYFVGCRKKLNLGYAFVNFTDPRAAWRFYKAANGKKWLLFHSKKISEIASARLQGKKQLVVHFENTLFACESEDFLPVTFNPARDGSNAGSVVQTTVGEIISPVMDHNFLPTIERRGL